MEGVKSSHSVGRRGVEGRDCQGRGWKERGGEGEREARGDALVEGIEAGIKGLNVHER